MKIYFGPLRAPVELRRKTYRWRVLRMWGLWFSNGVFLGLSRLEHIKE